MHKLQDDFINDGLSTKQSNAFGKQAKASGMTLPISIIVKRGYLELSGGHALLSDCSFPASLSLCGFGWL